ncbi:MAG TPA: ATP-binding protein, partial [Anaerolineae bacterium]
LNPIYGLLLTTVLAVIAYAVFNWQQYLEHEAFMKRLRPFVTSLHLQDHLVSADTEGWAESRELFTALCRAALGAERACLLFDRPTQIEAGDPRNERFDYFWPAEYDAVLAHVEVKPGEWTRLDADHWVWPLADSRGPIGRLVLGPKINGSEYTAQELQVAATCAERILDALAGEQIARVAMNLLRQRIAQVQVMSAQHKRMLHDDVLPQIHLALLKVEALRNGSAVDREAQIGEASAALTQTHRRLSSLVREMSNAVPTRLESEGLAAALKSAIDHDFHDSFDRIEWQASPAASERARQLPFFASEVIFYAAQEAIRNAARHGRGSDANRKLNLSVTIECDPELRIVIGDDGVGVAAQRKIEPSNGSGSGLLFHSTMLAVIGGALTVSDRLGGGTQVVINGPERISG